MANEDGYLWLEIYGKYLKPQPVVIAQYLSNNFAEKYSCTKKILAETKLELNNALEIALLIEMAEKQVLSMKTDVQNVDPELKLLKVDRGRTHQCRAVATTGNSAGNYRPKGQDGGRQY